MLLSIWGPVQVTKSRTRLLTPDNTSICALLTSISSLQCLTFGVVPQHLRIAFIAVVSFFWLIIFSSLTAKSQKERDLVEQEVGDTCSLEDGLTCKIDG
jgi:hypothetical protein